MPSAELKLRTTPKELGLKLKLTPFVSGEINASQITKVSGKELPVREGVLKKLGSNVLESQKNSAAEIPFKFLRPNKVHSLFDASDEQTSSVSTREPFGAQVDLPVFSNIQRIDAGTCTENYTTTTRHKDGYDVLSVDSRTVKD